MDGGGAPEKRKRHSPRSHQHRRARWGSWQADSADFWGVHSSGAEESLSQPRSQNSKEASSRGAGWGHLPNQLDHQKQGTLGSKERPPSRRDRTRKLAAISRSRSENVNVGAVLSKGYRDDVDTRCFSDSWQELGAQQSHRRRIAKHGPLVVEPKTVNSSMPTAAHNSSSMLLGCLVWGNAAASLLLVWLQLGIYLGSYSKQPYSNLAGAWAVLAVPLTYLLGGSLRFKRSWQAWQPFQGGAHFVLLQAAAWFFWAWALAPFVMPLLAELPPPSQASRHGVRMLPNLPAVHLAFSATSCAFAQLATSLSLSAFAPHSKIWPPQLRSSSPRRRPMPRSSETTAFTSAAVLWAQSKRCYRALISINISLATILCAIAAVYDVWAHRPAIHPSLPSSKHAPVALLCFLSLAVIGPSTHGLGGSLRYRHVWSFWQPFVGGLYFVVIQALAWAMFAAALAAFLLAAYCATALTSSRLGHGLLATAGFGGLASEVLMAASLLCYVAPTSNKHRKGKHAPRQLLVPAPALKEGAGASLSSTLETTVCQPGDGSLMAIEAPIGLLLTATVEPPHILPAATLREAVALPAHWLAQQARNKDCPPGAYVSIVQLLTAHMRVYSVLILFYCNHFFVIAGLVLPFAFLGPLKGPLLLLALFLLYLPTYAGSPHTTGRRKWEAAKNVLCNLLEEVAIYHWGGLRLTRTSKEPLDSSQSYVFGYHPHGLFPVTAAWFQATGAWRQLFPGVQPVSLAASACFMVPILRDLMLWAGNREVSRKGFQNALTDEKAVIVCPGGQSELCLHQPRHRKRFVLCARKKGFIRLAMQNGACLVPVFCFGESFMMHNLFDWPAFQRWTYRNVGFPVPFLPVGLCGVLPLPRRGAITIVVGEPIPTRSTSESRQANQHSPSEEAVEAMRIRYFQALAELFQENKEKHGFGDFELELRHT